MSYEEITFESSGIISHFKPNLTPKQIFQLGSFGGTYWRPIYSSVLGKELEGLHIKYRNIFDPHTANYENWFSHINEEYIASSIYDRTRNKYSVKVGTSLEYWEGSGWIHPQDPYGWIQWYFEFYSGRRSEDDERQIKRWLNISGPKGRFKKRLINLIKSRQSEVDDFNISPAIRQTLQHWSYVITDKDL